MKGLRIGFTVFVLLLGATVIPFRALAQPDHLVCYTMKDALAKFASTTTVDLKSTLQPGFSQAGCTIIKPFEFCVPAEKTVHNPPSPLVDIPGEPLTNDYICYIVKCPPQHIPGDRVVEDQFGPRLEQKYQVATMCVPAIKERPSCDPTSYPHCGGTCPDGISICQKDTAMKTCTCGGSSQKCNGGMPDAAGVCAYTDCPAPMTCIAVDKKTCMCGTPPPPLCDGSTPESGPGNILTCGERFCPGNVPCIVLNGVCQCQPAVSGCTGTTAAQCGMGTCPSGLTCTLDPLTNQCTCPSPPQPCSMTSNGCPLISDCATGTTCTFVPNTGANPGATCQCK